MVPVAELGFVSAVLVVIAFIVLLAYIVAGIVAILEQFPVVGKYFAGTAEEIIHGINAAAGRAVSGLFKIVGASWHALARYTDWLWREIQSHANVLAALAGPIGLLWTAYGGINSLVHSLTATNAHSGARLKVLERELRGIEGQVKSLEKEYRGIDELKLGKRLGSLDKELNRIDTQTIPAIQAADAQASSAISNLYDWAKGKASLLGVGTFAFAVAAVLDSLGLGSIRCSSLGNMFNKRGCGLWNDLESILGLLADTVLLTNICSLLPLLETAVSDVADPLVIALTDVGAGLCDGGIGPPLALPAVSLYLPASPSLTLNLP